MAKSKAMPEDIDSEKFWSEAFLAAWKEVLAKAEGKAQLQSPVMAGRAASLADEAESQRRARTAVCPECDGKGCDYCDGDGRVWTGIVAPPDIRLDVAPGIATPIEQTTGATVGSGGE